MNRFAITELDQFVLWKFQSESYTPFVGHCNKYEVLFYEQHSFTVRIVLRLPIEITLNSGPNRIKI